MNMFHQLIETFVAVGADVLVHHNKIDCVLFCMIFDAVRNKPNLNFEVV